MKRTDVIMNWYLERSQKEAQAEADILQALRDAAKKRTKQMQVDGSLFT
jgi:hypothetical protein